MCARSFILGTAILVASSPAAAQERGTIDLGAFLSFNSFASAYEMNSAIGFGGRMGAYLSRSWALEFEGHGGTAGRPSGQADRSYRFLDARLLFVPVKAGRMSVLVGAGAGHVDANGSQTFEDEAYGFHFLAGGRIALNDRTAMRLDYTRYINGSAQHGSLKAGLGLFRQPARKQTTVFRAPAASAYRVTP